MSAYLSKEILDRITDRNGRMDRLAIVSNDRRIPVRRRWSTGFAVAASDARHLRGLVELYEGETLIGWCLISSGTLDGDEHQFEFKRFTLCKDGPPVDFERIVPPELATDMGGALRL